MHMLGAIAGADDLLDVESPTKPNLNGPIHPIFQPERWPELKGNPTRYDSFRPSFILASRLLKVAGPFLASLIPRLRLDSKREKIVLNEKPTDDQLRQCFDELDLIAQHVEWKENAEMWPNLGRHGLTVPQGGGIKPDQPVRNDEDAEVWVRSTNRDAAKGYSRRRMTVYIASQYGDALMESAGTAVPTMRHSQAVFMCAITLVHEIAHVVYAARFSNKPWRGEPLVKNEVLPELGTSLIAWLFNGWIPENIGIDPHGGEDLAFRYGCCWYKQRRRPKAYPRYTTVHSMPMSHIQAVLNQAEWDKFNRYGMPLYSGIVRIFLLRPSWPFPAGRTARIAKKAKRFRVDESPSLISYSDVWDYHDPDWDDSGTPLRPAESSDSFVTPLVKLERDRSAEQYTLTGRKPSVNVAEADSLTSPVKRCGESETSSPNSLWSFPSVTQSSSPQRTDEVQVHMTHNGQKEHVNSGSSGWHPGSGPDGISSSTVSSCISRGSRGRRSDCPSPPSFQGPANRGSFRDPMDDDLMKTNYWQLDGEPNSFTQHGTQDLVMRPAVSEHIADWEQPAERAPRRRQSRRRQSRRLQGLGPEMPEGLPEVKKRRILKRAVTYRVRYAPGLVMNEL